MMAMDHVELGIEVIEVRTEAWHRSNWIWTGGVEMGRTKNINLMGGGRCCRDTRLGSD